MASYDQYKETLLRNNILQDGMPLYMVSAFGAGFTAVMFGSPLDVLTTIHMSSPGKYSSPIHCFRETIKSQGVGVLYRGFVPNVARVGGFNVVLWLVFENIQRSMRS